MSRTMHVSSPTAPRSMRRGANSPVRSSRTWISAGTSSRRSPPPAGFAPRTARSPMERSSPTASSTRGSFETSWPTTGPRGSTRPSAAVMSPVDAVADDATAVAPADVDRLRQLGFRDDGILDVVLAAAVRCFFSKTPRRARRRGRRVLRVARAGSPGIAHGRSSDRDDLSARRGRVPASRLRHPLLGCSSRSRSAWEWTTASASLPSARLLRDLDRP